MKGRYGYDFIHHPERILKPQVRRYLLEGKKKPALSNVEGSATSNQWDWVETDWDTALDITSQKLVGIKNNFGADSIGVLTSAKCTNEENYLMSKFTRQVLGTNNIDHCARL